MSTSRTRSTVIGVGAAVLVAAAGTVGGLAAAHATDSSPASPTTATTATATSAPGTTGSAKDGTTTRRHATGAVLAALKGVQHAQWVVKGKGGAYVTHDAIRGTVSAVSPTSITVEAADGVSQTYAVSATTTVTLRGAGAGATTPAPTGTSTPSSTASSTASSTTTASGTDGSPAPTRPRAARGSIGDVSTGATVLVTGTGTSALTAERILVPRG